MPLDCDTGCRWFFNITPQLLPVSHMARRHVLCRLICTPPPPLLAAQACYAGITRLALSTLTDSNSWRILARDGAMIDFKGLRLITLIIGQETRRESAPKCALEMPRSRCWDKVGQFTTLASWLHAASAFPGALTYEELSLKS